MTAKKNITSESFPMKALTGALILTMALFAIASWHIWRSYQDYKTILSRETRLRDLSGAIVYLDEVLTMSARMAATTGDTRWEERYRQFEPRLDEAIKEARSLAPSISMSVAVSQTISANLELIKMGEQAFGLIHEGRRPEAIALLSSEEYERQKRLYAQGLEQIDLAMMRSAEANLSSRRRWALFAVIAVAITLPVLLLTWYSVLRLVREHLAERKRAEETLRQSEEKYRTLVETAPEVVYSLSLDGRFTALNSTFEKVTGWSITECLGQPFVDFIHPEDLRSVMQMFERALHSESPVLAELRFRTKSGIYIIKEVVGTQLLENDKVVGVFGFSRDITERKRAEEALRQSEERYRTLFEGSKDAIYIRAREGQIVDVNPAFLDLFGYCREEVVGQNIQMIYLQPEDQVRFHQEIEPRGFVKDYELKLRKKDGTEIDCLVTSSIRRGSEGEILGYQGIVRDITERKKMEEELLKIRKIESLGILAGGIAHDFNNALTAILGNITLSKMYVNPEDAMFKRLAEAEKACLGARNLTQQLLTFSEGGAPVKRIGSVAKLLKESVELILKGSNVRCKFSLPEDLWPVEMDLGQIHQVIHNLVLNAVQAMPKGGWIQVQAENIMVWGQPLLPLPGGKYVKVSIQDEGVGIPEDHLPKIFDPYFTTKEKGSGLGLATAYSIIRNHRGYLTAESKIGVGTTLTFYLPTSIEEVLVEEVSRVGVTTGTGRVLVMDDEEMIRELAGALLPRLGYEVELAKDGAEAVALYKKAKKSGYLFSAVVLDVVVPGGMGGKETLQKLKEIDPGVKAIVSSGYSNDPILADFKKYGFDEALAKPYKIEDLSYILHKVITGRG